MRPSDAGIPGDAVIEPLDLGERAVAARVLELQRAAYAVEARLIGFDGIPPLHETLAELVAQPLEWRGISLEGTVVAAMAITGADRRCDIDRLVVDPAAHRQGLGRRLVTSVLHHQEVTVSTGEANTPAVALYRSLGFAPTGRTEVAPGVWTVQLALADRDRLRSSFDADPAGYEAARPGYPAALFDLLERRCGLAAGVTVLEVGPGTGQATLDLLDRGAHVVAVEPGRHLAARLRDRVAGRPCTVLESDLETVDPGALVRSSCPLAVAATSFHWVRPVQGMARLADLVEPGGWFVPFWTVFRDVGRTSAAFQAALEPIVRRFQTAGRVAAITHALDHDARRAEFEASGAFEVVDSPSVVWDHVHDAASLRALFASFSDWSILPEPDRTRALDDVAAIVDDHFGGSLTRSYATQIYLVRRR